MDLLKAKQAPQTGLIATTGTTPGTGTGVGKAVASVGSSIGSVLLRVVALLLVAVILYNLYYYVTGSKTLGGGSAAASPDLVPSAADGKKSLTVKAGSLLAGDGSDYGLQFWMYINDWNFGFGRKKYVLYRGVSPNASPVITLHPTDNSLDVQVPIYPSGKTTGSTSAAGDTYTCTVENVPLQAWFAVSMTVFQRNLDIYINGQLVKSCVLPGVPKMPSGDIKIGSTTAGFSGSVCNLKHLPRALVPADASSFFSAGTTCGKPTAEAVEPEGKGFTLFGYTFRFSIFRSGKSVGDYSF